MTGTALTEEKEFREIYGMDVVEIPTNKPVIRQDLDDAVYKTQKEKYRAVCRCSRRSTCQRTAGAGWYDHDRGIGTSEWYAEAKRCHSIMY